MVIHMASFQDIIGQELIKEHLQNAIQLNKISHAYVIDGERSSGKEFIAKVFAQTLQCEKGGMNPCNECHSCKQAESKNHPDIIRIVHEKPNIISVDDIRQQVTGDVQIKPYSSPYKVYIINDAEKMTVQAQNALLKTLEEPPSYVVLLLLSSNAQILLPTLLSRCVMLSMKPVENRLMRKYLMEQLEVPDYQADICVAFAKGNIGKAKSLASSEDFDNIKDEAVTVLKYIREMEINELVGAVKKIAEYKVDIDDYLDILMVWYRDVLLYKATHDVNDLTFKDELKYIKKQASESTYEGIEVIIRAIDKTKSRLSANVNFDLALELLLLTIKEN